MRTAIVRTATVMLVLTFAVALNGSPVHAAACPAPAHPDADGRVRSIPPGIWVGDGEYGGGQGVAFATVPGQRATYEVRYENVRNRPRGIEIRAWFGPEGHPESFRVRAFAGDVEVTAAVFGEGWKFRGVAPGSSTPPLRFTAKMKKSADTSHVVAVDVAGNYGDLGSAGDPACGDYVRFIAGN